MSLSALVARADVRALLDAHLRPLAPTPVGPVVTPRTGVTPTLIGAANDYALRWRLERYYGRRGVRVEAPPWVAREAARLIKAGALPGAPERAEALLRAGVLAHARFVSGEDRLVTPAAARALLGLAALDAVFREGRGDALDRDLPARDVQDLLALQGPVDAELLGARSRVFLNPHFGEASRQVGGADADFVLDATLVDLKTVSGGAVTPDMRRQLLGYLLLWWLEGGRLNGTTPAPLDALGVYFARHRTLVRWPLHEVIAASDLPELARDFARLARA